VLTLDPDNGCWPDHDPEARQIVTLLVVQLSQVLVPAEMVGVATLMEIVGAAA
jgi:hypothetical protein